MKFKVKVLMLLVSMLFGALGASAQIAEGQYKIKLIAQGKYLTSDASLVEEDAASVFDVAPAAGSGYTIKYEGKYLKSESWEIAFVTSESIVNITASNGGYMITDNEENGLYYGFGGVYFDNFYSECDYIWAFESISGGGQGPETPVYMELSENTTYYLSGKGLYLEPNNSISANYETGDLANNNATISNSKTLFGMWSIEKVAGQNYVYIRNLSSNAYLGKAIDALQLVKDEDEDESEAGKYYIFEDGSIQDSETNQYIAVTGDKVSGTVSISSTKGTWTFAEVSEYAKSITLNDYGYATTCMPFNFTVSEGTEIYRTTDVHDYSGYTTLKVHQVEGVAQAGQGYIIKGEPRAEVTLTLTTEEVNAESSMLGTLIRQTGVYAALRYKYYGFKGDEFVLASSDAIPANKAVYIPESASSVMKMSLGFDEGLTTEILGLTPDASACLPLYDLQGRSCMGQSHKGLYIQSGHKMIRR